MRLISEEIIELMGQRALSVIVDEISISVGSTPDIMNVDQLTLIIRCFTIWPG